jgi:long-subunit fatty acid transport protein
MPFARLDHRKRAVRARVVRAVVGLGLVLAGAAHAAPLDEPFVGGLSFSGPTSGNLAAVYWNPAALGLARGVQIMVAGSGRLATTTVTRAPIDPMTGKPGGTFYPGSATAHDLSQPLHWPIGPGGFFGVSWDLGGDRFTLAFATYEPFVEQVSFPTSPTGNEPTRYQALALDLRNVALVPALSIRLAGDFRVGFAPGFMFSTGRLSFAEDLALDAGSDPPNGLSATNCAGTPYCGAENAAAAARYNIDSGHGLSDAKFSLTLGGGIYYRRRSFEFGLAYSSRPIGGDVSGVEVAAEGTTVALPPRAGGGNVTCAGGLQTTRCVFGDLTYRLPDIWTAGVTWHIGPGLELTGMVRWIWFHLHDRIDVRLTGTTLDANSVPQHIVLYRGFQDVWDTRLRLAYWWRERVRVGATLRLETSAVSPNAVNAAAVDGIKLEPVLLAEVRVAKHLWLGGGYGITFMPDVTVTNSSFSPSAAVGCAKDMGNLGQPGSDCRLALDGRARPTANGTYARVVQDFGLTMTARF